MCDHFSPTSNQERFLCFTTSAQGVFQVNTYGKASMDKPSSRSLEDFPWTSHINRRGAESGKKYHRAFRKALESVYCSEPFQLSAYGKPYTTYIKKSENSLCG